MQEVCRNSLFTDDNSTAREQSRSVNKSTRAVEASNVISDPKCNKGPNCNNFWPQM